MPPGRGLERGKDGKGRVFGVSLEQSLQYASVAISMVGAYVPHPSPISRSLRDTDQTDFDTETANNTFMVMYRS